jgi:hypothetical protein
MGDHIDMYDIKEREAMRSGKPYSEIISVLQGKID